MKEKKVFYGWWILLGCILTTATVIPPVVSLSSKYTIAVTQELGLQRSEFIFTSTLSMAVGIFVSTYASKKLSRGNMRIIQSLAVLIFCLAYASYSLAQNKYHLYLISLVIGVTYTFSGLLPVALLINNWFIEKRGFAMSMAMTGIGFGGMIFSQVITHFIQNYGWRASYQYMAIIVLVIALPISLFLFKKSPSDIGLNPYGVNNEVTSVKSEKKQYGVRLSVQECYYKPFFILLLAGIFLNGFINTGALMNFPPALQDLQDQQTAALIISIYSFVGIFGKIVLGWINDKFGIIWSSIFGCAFFASAFLFILLGESMTMLYIMGISFGLGNAIGTVSPPLLTASMFNNEKYPAAIGIVTAIGQIGTTIGGLAIGKLFDFSGSYTFSWILLGFLTLLTLTLWISSYQFSKRYA